MVVAMNTVALLQPPPSLLSSALIWPALGQAFLKLHPRRLAKNPVMMITAVMALAVSASAIEASVMPPVTVATNMGSAFLWQVAAWLWATVLFGNLAESLAEGRGKAQASTLRAFRSQTLAKKVSSAGATDFSIVPAPDLSIDDIVLCRVGDVIPCDGEVVAGIASIDESAITGESAPVIRESGGDRSAVTNGTMVLSDTIWVRVTVAHGHTFLDRMIALVEGAQRQKTPNEMALHILLVGFSLLFLLVTASLLVQAAAMRATLPPAMLAALLVALIPTTISGLLSAIGIAGMNRLLRFNVLAVSGRAVEAAGDIDVLLLDKTGTITLGNRMASEFLPLSGVDIADLAEACWLSSVADETAEGRSIVELALKRYGVVNSDLTQNTPQFVQFTAQTRTSGINLPDRQIRKGAVDAVLNYLTEQAGQDAAGYSALNNPSLNNPSKEFALAVESIARSGGTPLAVGEVTAEGTRLLGVIHLKDIIKTGIRQRFAELRRMGIKTVMITGDNKLTAAAIAAEAGVDDVIAQATPENKLHYIRTEQAAGRMVAMCGDGTNDAPALAQSDVGVAMQSGTQAAREAGNMVDLDSDPTKLIEIVGIGKQLLITRGALTTFSIANDLAKYFAVLPALFIGAFPQLQAMNIMQLANPQSAILSAIIFNALIIVALIPLALRGVRYRPLPAGALLRRNLLIYGLGGIVTPFVGIKLIDGLVRWMEWA
jgi:K+-transporting ATPase ATPase B chain